MRYYAIRVIDPISDEVVTFDNSTGTFTVNPSAPYTWGSHDINGILMPGALNVEIDVPSVPFAAFQGAAHLRVWGVGLTTLAQANNLAGYGIEILAGMQPPYNLNAAAKLGKLAVGQIFQCWGNWEGINQYLDFLIYNASVDPELAVPISFTWKKGTLITQAITASLNAAFPTYTVSVASGIKSIIATSNTAGAYPNRSSLESFASWIAEITSSSGYSGIQITATGTTFSLYDDNVPTDPVTVLFQDLIGQPTWLTAATITFSTVMRADITLGSVVQLPSGLSPPYVLTTQQAAFPNAPSSNQLALKGNFTIIEAHHYGNFREADAASWRTVYVGAING